VIVTSWRGGKASHGSLAAVPPNPTSLMAHANNMLRIVREPDDARKARSDRKCVTYAKILP
jgi:hypothetical protein